MNDFQPTETAQMRDGMTSQQRFAAVVDTMRQALTDIAIDPYAVPRLTYAPRAFVAYWWKRWLDGFRPAYSCEKMRKRAQRALDEAAEITGQPWRGITRVTAVRPRESPYKVDDRPPPEDREPTMLPRPRPRR